jgi:hypothetical protein
MIKPFVDAFMERKGEIRDKWRQEPPGSYIDVVKGVVEILPENNWGQKPDPERIHQIDDGDYQGTLVFVIGSTGYQPSDYWNVMVGYGSCSGCDTLEAIRSWRDGPVTERQLDDYMSLALHVVQGLRSMGEEVS